MQSTELTHLIKMSKVINELKNESALFNCDDALKAKYIVIKNAYKELEFYNRNLINEIMEKNEIIEKRNNKISQYENELFTTDDEINSFKNEIFDLQNMLNKKNDEIKELQREFIICQKFAHATIEENFDIDSMLSRNESKYNKLKMKYYNSLRENTDLKRRLGDQKPWYKKLFCCMQGRDTLE